MSLEFWLYCGKCAIWFIVACFIGELFVRWAATSPIRGESKDKYDCEYEVLDEDD